MSLPIVHRTVQIDGLDIFYREAGPRDAPTVVLLHGFPTSSHMFRNLIPRLSDKYHVIAPDYPGYGYSAMPSVDEFEYTFDNIATILDKLVQQVGVRKYSLYLMDYGAPVGFRLAVRHPERVESLIIQNGNAYDEGLLDFWKPLKAFWEDQSPKNAEALKGLLTIDATKWQYTHGVRNAETISPDTWGHVQPLLDREGNQAIQLAMFLDYGSNPARYPKVASVSSRASATDSHRMGQKRSDLPGRRSPSVQARPEESGVSLARHWALRTRGRRRRDRQSHA